MSKLLVYLASCRPTVLKQSLDNQDEKKDAQGREEVRVGKIIDGANTGLEVLICILAPTSEPTWSKFMGLHDYPLSMSGV